MTHVELSDATTLALIRVQRRMMSDWSEMHWAAGWMRGLENELWHGSNQEMAPYDQDIADIHALAAITGFWCEYEDQVPLDVWEEMHGPPLTHMADEPPTPGQIAALKRVHDRQVAWWKEIGLMKDGDE